MSSLEELVQDGHDMCVSSFFPFAAVFLDEPVVSTSTKVGRRGLISQSSQDNDRYLHLKYYAVALATLQFYDYLLILPDEVRSIRSSIYRRAYPLTSPRCDMCGKGRSHVVRFLGSRSEDVFD